MAVFNDYNLGYVYFTYASDATEAPFSSNGLPMLPDGVTEASKDPATGGIIDPDTGVAVPGSENLFWLADSTVGTFYLKMSTGEFFFVADDSLAPLDPASGIPLDPNTGVPLALAIDSGLIDPSTGVIIPGSDAFFVPPVEPPPDTGSGSFIRQTGIVSWPSLAEFKADATIQQKKNDEVRIDGLLKKGTTWLAVDDDGTVTPDDEYMLRKDTDYRFIWWASTISNLLVSGVSLPLSDILDNTETLETISVPGAVPGGAYAIGSTSGDTGLRLFVQTCITPDELIIRVRNNSGATVPATIITLNVYALDAPATAPIVSDLIVAGIPLTFTLSTTTPNDIDLTTFLSTVGLGGVSIIPDMDIDPNVSFSTRSWGYDFSGSEVQVAPAKIGGAWSIHFFSGEPDFAFYLRSTSHWTDGTNVYNYNEFTNPVTNQVWLNSSGSEPSEIDPAWTLLGRDVIDGLHGISISPTRVDTTFTNVLTLWVAIPMSKFDSATMI